MKAWYSKDVQALIRVELERNAKVQALVGDYKELTETEKLLFRVAAGISQDAADNNGERWRRPGKERGSEIGRGEVQRLVKDLMKTLLEGHPTLLNDADQRNLMDTDYCKDNLYLHIGNFALLRRSENGKFTARYWAKLYGGKFYVCNNWWKDYHFDNAQSLLRFVTELAQRNPNHPGVPVLERHKQALQDYIG